MTRVLRKDLLASYLYMIQCQTFMMIERGFVFNSWDSYLYNFKSEEMDLDVLMFGSGVLVPCFGPVT